MRDKKNNISLDVDSALALMQEIYNDVVDNKNSAVAIMKKMTGFMKDSTDITVIGPIIKDQQKILNDCIQKKIYLSKLQTSLLKNNSSDSNNKNKASNGMSMTEEDRKILNSLLDGDNKNTNKGDGIYGS